MSRSNRPDQVNKRHTTAFPFLLEYCFFLTPHFLHILFLLGSFYLNSIYGKLKIQQLDNKTTKRTTTKVFLQTCFQFFFDEDELPDCFFDLFFPPFDEEVAPPDDPEPCNDGRLTGAASPFEATELLRAE